MSTFKSNMDAMFAKIFPAAAEATQEDHGGFNLGDLVVIILDLVLLIYTGYRSWHFLSGSVSSDFQILALVGLWGLDIGMVAWSLVWIFGSATRFQNWASMGLFVIDMLGMFLTSIVDTLAYGNGDTLPPIMKSVAWYGIPIIIGLNVLAGFVYHMTSPSTRKRRAERAQDEEMSKQQEKGDLELRRMTMQLQQAQDYTASGQLGGLMNATGLNMPGINLPQPENKPNVMDKLKELKDKFVLKNDEAEANIQQPATLPLLQPVPMPAGFGGNGNGSNADPH